MAAKGVMVWALVLAVLALCIPARATTGKELLPPEPEEILETVPEESLPEEVQPSESLLEEVQPSEPLPEDSLEEESVSEETAPQTLSPEEPLPEAVLLPEAPTGPGLYFGRLHAHTSLSDSTATLENTFQSAAQTEGLDFFVITDHGDSLNALDWAAGKAAAAEVTGPGFVGIFGYEMSWPSRMQVGHIGAFATPDFLSWEQEPFRAYRTALPNFYEALSSAPGAIGQFNHPGSQYGTFQDFDHYSLDADRVMNLMEVDFQERNPLHFYIQALDLGWHLAPTAGAEAARTVVNAQSLTEAGIYDALRNCRAYATEDPDLEIIFSLDGHGMGSRLARQQLGQSCEIAVSLLDPTDAAIGMVEVMGQGGAVLATQNLYENSGTLTFSLPVQSGWYFLSITQPDGNRAVTAPIWVEGEGNLEITGFSCETPVPVQKESIPLALELYNGRNADFLVDTLEILADGAVVGREDTLSILPANTALTHRFSFVFDCVGMTKVSVRILGTIAGEKRTLEGELSLSFRQSQQVTALWVDGSHGNMGLDQLTRLQQLAEAENIRFTLETEGIPVFEDCRLLLICAPTSPFSPEFLTAVEAYAAYGSSLILCGRETDPDGTLELNRVLAAVGSSMILREDSVQTYSDNICLDSPWCAGVTEDQVYRHAAGCSVEPGSGTVLVRTREGTPLLAAEPLSGGGTVFVSGSLFLSDEDLAEPKNLWDAPYANRTIAGNLLGIGGEVLPLSTIRQARTGEVGALFRVRGYVTGGFPETLYLQDDTGGIPIVPFSEEGIQPGMALEITGFAVIRQGNRALKPSSWKALQEVPMELYLPIRGSWDSLLNIEENGGRLVEVEGLCLEIYCREDGTLSGCLLKNDQNQLAVVELEDALFSGDPLEKALHKNIRKDRTVRAMGLLHRNVWGETVIRVRNPEEVVYVPIRDPSNPPTGDAGLPVGYLLLSTAGLLLLKRRKWA